jgi:putative nucleotidyltransferase with HDIG domain
MFGFGSKTRQAGTSRRREELRRTLPKPGPEFVEWARRPESLTAVAISTVAGVLFGILVAVSSEEPRVFVGQLALTSAVNPRSYALEDRAATSEQRESARKAAPRHYVANVPYLSSQRAAIEGLPVAAFEKPEVALIDPDLVLRFDLTDESLRLLQEFGGSNVASDQWRTWTERFIELLWAEEPIIANPEYQVFALTHRRFVSLPPAEPGAPEASPREVGIAHELPTGPGPQMEELRRALRRLARRAGFPDALSPVIAAAVANDPRPTVTFDEPRTRLAGDLAAAAVEPVLERHPRGEVLFTRGDVLNAESIARYATAIANDRTTRSRFEQAAAWGGSIGLGLALSMLVLVYTIRHEPRIGRRPPRLAGIFALMLVPAAVSAVASAVVPIVTPAATAGAVLVVAIVASLAYGQRFALFLTAIAALLMTLSIDAEATLMVVLFLGGATAIGLLREVRHRAAVVRASGWTALVLALAYLAYGLHETRLAPGGWWNSLRDAFLAAIASYAVGFLILGILPPVERLFGMTTGLTLAELRDPRHPLLRQMQERAPGTYNHSLQVANLAEAAAESIGADGLLAYAGALYHDIGKINKPEYFVENQGGFTNKHERLSPAMSLLVIVGHVKDGMELAKEYGLPKVLRHFIESHHGTTLVEYFYHRARTEAERRGEGEDVVAEFDYRYPGPKPRTKESAILMLADAAESASRALPEPTHGRLESLVRGIAKHRLEDGQFDDCPLTFAELRVIEDSIIKSLVSIHHTRIAYPSTAAPIAPAAEPPASAAGG